MMFHLAAPEVNGLGVTTLTPGLSRSSQPWIPLGLPLRTTNETSDVVTKPPLPPAASVCDTQWEGTSLGSTSLSTSGASEKATTSAFWPAATARLCSPDAP